MKYYELKLQTKLKSKIHFQKSPEAISKMIATALINSGYGMNFIINKFLKIMFFQTSERQIKMDFLVEVKFLLEVLVKILFKNYQI